MAKRHQDALYISAGACNPSGMANSLVSACKECINEGVQQQTDPAVRLIVSQIAYICGIWDGVSDWKGGNTLSQFHDATQACEDIVQAEKNAAEGLVRQVTP